MGARCGALPAQGAGGQILRNFNAQSVGLVF